MDVDTDSKSYRLQSGTSSASNSSRSPSAPSDLRLQRLLQALAKGKKKDQQIKRNARLSQGHLFWNEIPMDEDPPLQVVRFDLGLGYTIDPSLFQPYVATTGHRRLPSAIEAPADRRSLFARQGVLPQRQSCAALTGEFLLQQTLKERYSHDYELAPICADGRDNNGNGLIDRNDPACWIDGTNRSTYSKHLDEGRMFLPLNRSVPNIPVAPSIADPTALRAAALVPAAKQ